MNFLLPQSSLNNHATKITEKNTHRKIETDTTRRVRDVNIDASVYVCIYFGYVSMFISFTSQKNLEIKLKFMTRIRH